MILIGFRYRLCTCLELEVSNLPVCSTRLEVSTSQTFQLKSSTGRGPAELYGIGTVDGVRANLPTDQILAAIRPF